MRRKITLTVRDGVEAGCLFSIACLPRFQDAAESQWITFSVL